MLQNKGKKLICIPEIIIEGIKFHTCNLINSMFCADNAVKVLKHIGNMLGQGGLQTQSFTKKQEKVHCFSADHLHGDPFIQAGCVFLGAKFKR